MEIVSKPCKYSIIKGKNIEIDKLKLLYSEIHLYLDLHHGADEADEPVEAQDTLDAAAEDQNFATEEPKSNVELKEKVLRRRRQTEKGPTNPIKSETILSVQDITDV